MHSRESVLALLATLKDDLAVRFPVARIGVLGPDSRGEQTLARDIDSRPRSRALYTYFQLRVGGPE